MNHTHGNGIWQLACYSPYFLCLLERGACAFQTLAEPVKGQVVQHRQPTLRWGGKSSDTFRVQVAALLPEARILASYDVMVRGTSFTLPAALPGERAAVKVPYQARLDGLEAQDVNSQGAWFFVDLRDGCSIERSELRLSPWAADVEACRCRQKLQGTHLQDGRSVRRGRSPATGNPLGRARGHVSAIWHARP